MNVGKRISAHKSAVDSLYRQYIQLRGNHPDGVDPSVLDQQVEAMKEGKFRLVVAGEVSSGKSTFINALMGEEILPSSVLQTTSAIVEIYKSISREIEVVFANGHRKKITDGRQTQEADELTQELGRICAVQEKYRAIPTSVINDFLLMGITDIRLDVLEKRSGTRLNGKERLIEEYIEEYKGLDKIPTDIFFGYPFKYAFSDIRLVDTPGVNARGGLQDLTFNYVRGANAILFLHNIMPVESESFRKFVDTCVPNHSLETLFLVLSHAGDHVPEEVCKLVSEARNLYPELEPRKVVPVDSLYRLAFHELKHRELSDVMKNAKMKKILSEYVIEANGDRDAVLSTMGRMSNFDELEQIIERFSMRAPSLQLVQVLKTIQTGIENLVTGWEEGIELRKKKMEDPQEFENRIAAIIKVLEEYKFKMNTFSKQIQQRYVSTGGETENKLDRLKGNYKMLFDHASSRTHLLKHISDFEHDCADLLDNLARLMRDEYVAEMKRIGKELSDNYDVKLPRLDMHGLEEKAKNEAYVEVEKTVPGSGFGHKVGKTFRKGLNKLSKLFGKKFTADDVMGDWGKDKKIKEKILDEVLFLSNLKQEAIRTMLTFSNYIENLCSSVIKKYDPIFREALTKIIEEMAEALESLRLKKQSNDEIVGEITELKNLLNESRGLHQKVTNVMEDLQ
jgi:GTPase SAR1 family protein